MLLEFVAEEISVVGLSAFIFVELLSLFATVAACEFETSATFFFSPVNHGVPKFTADALAAD